MKIKQILSFVVLVLLATVTASYAQTVNKTLDGWTLLGTRAVDYTLDRDVITVEASRNTLTSLKFIVKNGTLNMHKATIHYSNGDTQEIKFPEEVNKLNDNRIIDLAGNSRSIDKVTFWYDTKSASENKATIELWGLSLGGL